MNRILYFVCCGLFLYLTTYCSYGHQEPTSFLDLKIEETKISLAITASSIDLAHDLDRVEPAMLLNPKVLEQNQKIIADKILSRLTLLNDGIPLTAKFTSASANPDKGDLRFEFFYPTQNLAKKITVECDLFPYDLRHRSYLNAYQGKTLIQQLTFDKSIHSASFSVSSHQDIGVVIREFTYEGIHHIFIGPDHILFVIGLILLGGQLTHLLKILTAFTIAHSITLCLATFRILSPPASIIEPVIALSIVVVGIHAVQGKKLHDPRMWFAFGFGLIHGFGFASVLQEMALPAQAIGWSLFSFNFGVEIGQACIVLSIAPLLALLRNYSPKLSIKVIHTAALGVTTAGAFWFFQRIL